ncbi:beta-N-acetylhexosaminidase [Lentzea sp. NPDC003310]|uniref:beta-N-acetylhexosaminidase n=1 Tax=Lentzea sp. NPDC003310 TaxID=3154447 RepID=UPI0033BE68BE
MKSTQLQAALTALAIAGSGVLVTEQAEAAPATTLQELVPQPAQVKPHPEITFTLTNSAKIQVATPEAQKPAELLASILRPSTGYDLPIEQDKAPTDGIVLTAGADEKTGPEGYQLDVTPNQVVIRANTTAGHFNGIQTLRQLLPPQIEAKTRQHGPWHIPGASILDHPRYHHRGAMLDVSRHFFTPEQVKRYIDQIAAFKINYFHLHLTDDQGWRLEIESWPELTKIGGSTEVGGRTGELFYTQDQYRDLVAYAADRGITVIPEFDMPGHTNAAQASYAELNSDGEKKSLYTGIEVGFSSLCINEDITYRFVEDVIREVAAITPGPYLHIGGDEALSTPDADYQTFMDRVLPLVEKYGKTTVGWHEYIKTTEDTSVIPQFWGTTTTDDNVAAAAERGNKVLMSPANRIYLDMKYDKDTELGLDWAGHVEVKDSYSWNPGAYLNGVTEASVRGVEAPLWTETVQTSADIEYMAFPRLPVAAELGWAPASAHDWDRFAPALGAQAPRWRVQGVNFYASGQVPWKQ